jgi:hypothetical protein
MNSVKFVPFGIKVIMLFISAIMWMNAQSQYYEPSLHLPYFNALNGTGANAPTGVKLINAKNTDTIGSLSVGVYFMQVSVSNSIIAKMKFVKQ